MPSQSGPTGVSGMLSPGASPPSAPSLVFPWHAGNDPGFLLEREWLVTNGLGGYASGTLLGVATRRYHGLFIPNLPAPRGRTLMLPRLDEEVQVGARVVRLGGAEFADGRITGEWHRALREFRYEWRTPIWLFAIDEHLLQKRITMPYSQNTVCIEYRVLAGGPIRLNLRPFVSLRSPDGPLGCPTEWPFTLTITKGRYEVHPFEGAPALKLCLRRRPGVFIADQCMSGQVFYRDERRRGYDHLEDLFSPGYFTVELPPGEAVALMA
ncbi:MAG: glycogen debranching enzyme N-terminal domain-containing protein, partial [Candidatus Entotheonellia bacterium]